MKSASKPVLMLLATMLLIVFAIGCGTTSAAPPSKNQFLYVSDSASNKISAFLVDKQSGALTELTGSPFSVGASPAAVRAAFGKFLYVVNFNDGNISGFTIDPKTGIPTSMGQPFRPPQAPLQGPLDARIDWTGRFLYVGNSAANSVSAFSINSSTGALTFVGTVASGSTATSSPGALAIDPSGRYVYAVNANESSVTAFSINSGSGALTSIASYTTGTAAAFPDGIAFDASGKFLYVANSGDNDLKGFSINPANGTLAPINGTFATGSSPFFIAQADGFMYVTNDVGNSVSIFSVKADGSLAAVGSAVPAGNAPAGLTADSNGQFLYVAVQSDNKIAAFSVNQGDGSLTAMTGATVTNGSTPGDLVAVATR